MRLADGPHDGSRDLAVSGEVMVYEVDTPPSGSSGAVPLLACYVPSQDDAAVYVFAGVERDLRRPTGPVHSPSRTAGRARPRVYELAAEFGVENTVVMAKLLEMGEFIRSTSSTVEHLAAQKLREQLAAQAPRKTRTSA